MTDGHGGGDRRGGKYLAIMSVGALGVVYGDIGTSPLYALREAFVVGSLEVSKESILGVLSLMFTAMVLVVSVKYLLFVMRADNDGEGGILALTSLIKTRGGRGVLLVGIGLFGTALLYGDGMITPAISVLAAVEGVEVAVPALEPFVVVIASLILVGLFMVQRRGTAAIGAVFGPIMLVWFSVLAGLGVHQIAAEPSVLAALNPLRGVAFLGGHPRLGFLALGAIFLVVTGSEALYADMGHFGRSPIRIGWFTVVFPALVLNYFGQGALVLADPAAIDNPFYRMAPAWAGIPLVVLATMATVIASQALISGAFSLTMQAVRLDYLPRQRIDHTSPHAFGQIYIPAVNWILMVATVGLVVTFRSSSNLAAAYGVAVTTTMVITTVLMYVVMRRNWGWSLPVAGGLTALFAVVDLAFFGANVLKIPAGGWVPLLIGFVVFGLMATWRKGRQLVATAVHRAELPIEQFIESIVEHPQVRVPGTAVYMFPDVGATPPALLANLRHNEVIHDTVALVSVEIARRARVPQAQRAAVRTLGEGFVEIVLHFGFMERPNVPEALRNIVSHDFGFTAEETTYFLGRETVVSTRRPGMAQWRERLFSALQRNATSAVRFFGLPLDRVVEVGVAVAI